jgi:hypothetical protein
MKISVTAVLRPFGFKVSPTDRRLDVLRTARKVNRT